jgi:uncharacterized membrane protein YeiB
MTFTDDAGPPAALPRLAVVDAVRGFALFGVLGANLFDVQPIVREALS